MGWSPVGRKWIQVDQYRLTKHQAERNTFRKRKETKTFFKRQSGKKTKNGGRQKKTRVKHGTTAELRDSSSRGENHGKKRCGK